MLQIAASTGIVLISARGTRDELPFSRFIWRYLDNFLYLARVRMESVQNSGWP